MTDAIAETPGAEVIERAELVPVEQQSVTPSTVFGTSDPDAALEKMASLARRLVDVVRGQKLAVKIQGREHLRVEAWTTLGGMLGIFPIVVWTRPNESGDGYLARVEVRTRAGELVGAAESECSREERVWHDRYPYSLRGMAQTRAISRALRAPLGQIVTLAGYDATPLEEMPSEALSSSESKPNTVDHAESASAEQLEEIVSLLGSLEEIDDERDWRGEARRIAGGSADTLTRGPAETVIKRLRERLKAATE